MLRPRHILWYFLLSNRFQPFSCTSRTQMGKMHSYWVIRGNKEDTKASFSQLFPELKLMEGDRNKSWRNTWKKVKRNHAKQRILTATCIECLSIVNGLVYRSHTTPLSILKHSIHAVKILCFVLFRFTFFQVFLHDLFLFVPSSVSIQQTAAKNWLLCLPSFHASLSNCAFYLSLSLFSLDHVQVLLLIFSLIFFVV